MLPTRARTAGLLASAAAVCVVLAVLLSAPAGRRARRHRSRGAGRSAGAGRARYRRARRAARARQRLGFRRRGRRGSPVVCRRPAGSGRGHRDGGRVQRAGLRQLLPQEQAPEVRDVRRVGGLHRLLQEHADVDRQRVRAVWRQPADPALQPRVVSAGGNHPGLHGAVGARLLRTHLRLWSADAAARCRGARPPARDRAARARAPGVLHQVRHPRLRAFGTSSSRRTR